MTAPNKPLAVSEEAREAAANDVVQRLIAQHGGMALWMDGSVEAMRRGYQDHDPLVRRWACFEAAIRADERARTIEQCAQTCEDFEKGFLSEEYAVDQPLSSFNERFACRECAAGIRALTKEPQS